MAFAKLATPTHWERRTVANLEAVKDLIESVVSGSFSEDEAGIFDSCKELYKYVS